MSDKMEMLMVRKKKGIVLIKLHTNTNTIIQTI